MKKFFIFLSFFLLSFPAFSKNFCADPTTVGCWKMDGATKTLTDYSATGANLSDGTNGGGYIVSGAFQGPTRATDIVPPGYSGMSRGFRDSTLLSGDISSTGLNIHGTSSQLWLHACVKSTMKPSLARSIFIAGKHSPRKKQGQYFLDLYGTAFSTYKARFGVSADGVDAVVATTAKAFDINEYHCFTGTYDGANLKIYADGLLAGNPIPYKSGIFSGAAPFTVGNTKPESSIFVGNIDEVAIGNVALSDAQVAELYRFGIDGTNGASDTRKPYTLYYPKASWNRNTSYEQILAEISALCSANPSWICRTEGLSGSGREIKSITIPPERALMKTVFLDAAIHGNEKPPVFALMGFLHFLSDHPSLFPTTKIVVYPVVNPDGFVLNQRKNDNKATGESADLNRNFPQIPNGKKPNPESAPRQDVAPASQPETQALMQALKNSRPDKYLNFHTPIDAFMIPGGSGGAAPKAVNNYLEAQGFLKFGVQGGGMPGSAVNWALSNGAEAYVLETRDIDDSDYANLEEYNRIIGAIVGYIDTPVPAKRPPSSRH